MNIHCTLQIPHQCASIKFHTSYVKFKLSPVFKSNQSIIHFIPLCKNKLTYICPQPSTKNKSIKRTKSWWHGLYPVLDKMLCSSLLYPFQWCWTIYCNSTTFLTTSATVVSKHSERTVGRRQIIYTVLGNFVLEPQK